MVVDSGSQGDGMLQSSRPHRACVGGLLAVVGGRVYARAHVVGCS